MPVGSVEQETRPDDLDRPRAFAAYLERHRGERHIVALQDFPDPDAISSAIAYRVLADHFDIKVDIVYDGRISHQENLALVHLPDHHIHIGLAGTKPHVPDQ